MEMVVVMLVKVVRTKVCVINDYVIISIQLHLFKENQKRNVYHKILSVVTKLIMKLIINEVWFLEQ